MSSKSTCVIVLAPNGHRQTVKVTPNTTMLQILEEVCKKQGFEMNDYDIKHHNKVLDTNSVMRFSGLPNNAQLEMCSAKKARTESEVTLGLQLESTGERLIAVFEPQETVWSVLQQLCPAEQLHVHGQVPVVVYMRQEVVGQEALERATLRWLGITSGRAVLRLQSRPADAPTGQQAFSGPLVFSFPLPEDKKCLRERVTLSQPLGPTSQAAVCLRPSEGSVPLVSNERHAKDKHSKHLAKSEEEVVASGMCNSMMDVSGTVTAPPSERVSAGSVERKKKKGSEDGNAGTSSDHVDITGLTKDIVYLGERKALLFNFLSFPTLSHVDPPEDFFNVTVEDARTLYRDLKMAREQFENQPLVTNVMRVSQANPSMFKTALIRVHFPDRIVLQAEFAPDETVATLMEFVSNFLEQPKTSFYLYLTPPKRTLHPSESLSVAGCVPKAMVYFGPTSSLSSHTGSYIKKALMGRLTSAGLATLAASQIRATEVVKMETEDLTPHAGQNRAQANQRQAQANHSQAQASQPSISHSASTSRAGRSSSMEKKVPKWFKQ